MDLDPDAVAETVPVGPPSPAASMGSRGCVCVATVHARADRREAGELRLEAEHVSWRAAPDRAHCERARAVRAVPSTTQPASTTRAPAPSAGRLARHEATSRSPRPRRPPEGNALRPGLPEAPLDPPRELALGPSENRSLARAAKTSSESAPARRMGGDLPSSFTARNSTRPDVATASTPASTSARWPAYGRCAPSKATRLPARCVASAGIGRGRSRRRRRRRARGHERRNGSR